MTKTLDKWALKHILLDLQIVEGHVDFLTRDNPGSPVRDNCIRRIDDIRNRLLDVALVSVEVEGVEP